MDSFLSKEAVSMGASGDVVLAAHFRGTIDFGDGARPLLRYRQNATRRRLKNVRDGNG